VIWPHLLSRILAPGGVGVVIAVCASPGKLEACSVGAGGESRLECSVFGSAVSSQRRPGVGVKVGFLDADEDRCILAGGGHG
jgi:hypothetical protein